MARGQQWLAIAVAAAVVAVMASFLYVRSRFGPAPASHPGRMVTFICAEPHCGRVEILSLSEQEANDPARWPVEMRCPSCGGVMRRAERCTSCGALVPTPADGHVLGARCPRCGEEIFGPVGGVIPLPPIRPEGNTDE